MSTLITPAVLRRWALPQPEARLGKESRGCVLVVGGSVEMPGAAILAAVAALRVGAGKLQIATSAKVATAVAVTVPEARVIGLRQDRRGELARGSCRAIYEELSRCDALLVGPGMVSPHAAEEIVRHCARARLSAAIVVDAAALSVFKGRKPLARAHGIIITPHPGEMASMWGVHRDEVLHDPLSIAREVAAELGVIVALKGACTHVVAPDGTAYHNTAGNIGLGTSGSGDTLAGVIAGLCARGAPPLQAAAWGVYLHARAGELLAKKRGPLGFLARELLTEIPALVAQPSRRA